MIGNISILVLIAGLSVILIGLLLTFIFIAIWIAKGESDVNGDPERDGGLEE
jgi:hypothetical protein